MALLLIEEGEEVSHGGKNKWEKSEGTFVLFKKIEIVLVDSCSALTSHTGPVE